MPLKETIQQLAREHANEIKAIRHHLHANPELSFEEHNTCDFISEQLNTWGINHEKGICNTGIVGVIEGSEDNGKVYALRADIDALPIHEISDKRAGSVAFILGNVSLLGRQMP